MTSLVCQWNIGSTHPCIIIAISFVLDFIHHVVDNSFNNVFVNVEDNL